MLDDTERKRVGLLEDNPTTPPPEPVTPPPQPPEPPPPEPPEEPSEPAPTVESLQRELKRANRFADLFRQQRNSATTLANDLQAELADCRADLEEAQQQLAALAEA